MAMSYNKVHSRSNVPFSWENKPGVSKMVKPSEEVLLLNLPLPPCPSEILRFSIHKLQIPLPPCTFPRNYYSKGMKKQLDLEDPFLAAYIKCTKGSISKGKSKERRGFGANLQRKMSSFSCKQSVAVRDDNLIRVSHFR